MIPFWYIISIISLWLQAASGNIDYEFMRFIQDYFSGRKISIIVLFTCSDEDNHKLVKFLSSSSKMWVYAPGPGQRNGTLEVFAPQMFHRTGVYLDYTCNTGKELLFLITNIPPENIEEEILKPESIDKDRMAVYNYRVNMHIRRMFNFTVTLVTTTEYGYVVAEGKYEGMVKLIGDKEAHMSISSMIMNSQERLDHVHFVPGPTWNFRLAAIFRHPPVTGGYNALLQPFSPLLWMCALFVWLLIAVFLWLMSWVQDHVSQDYHEDIDDRHSWSDVLLLIAGTLGEQGTDLDSRWITWRLVFLTMLVLTVLLNNYYGACVVSSLLSEAPKNIKTPRDLINSVLKFGAEDNNYNSKFFEFDSDPVVHALYKKMLDHRNKRPVYYTRDEGVRKMLHEEFAYHVESITVYPLIESTFPDKEKCSLTEITVYPPRKSYISVTFKSPYREILAYGMLRLGESGILSHMNLELLPRKPTCSSKGELISVGAVYVVPAFGILLIGMVLSIFVVALERAWHHRTTTAMH